VPYIGLGLHCDTLLRPLRGSKANDPRPMASKALEIFKKGIAIFSDKINDRDDALNTKPSQNQMFKPSGDTVHR